MLIMPETRLVFIFPPKYITDTRNETTKSLKKIN